MDIPIPELGVVVTLPDYLYMGELGSTYHYDQAVRVLGGNKPDPNVTVRDMTDQNRIPEPQITTPPVEPTEEKFYIAADLAGSSEEDTDFVRISSRGVTYSSDEPPKQIKDFVVYELRASRHGTAIFIYNKAGGRPIAVYNGCHLEDKWTTNTTSYNHLKYMVETQDNSDITDTIDGYAWLTKAIITLPDVFE